MSDKTTAIVAGSASLAVNDFFYIKWDSADGAFKYCSSTGTDLSGNQYVALITGVLAITLHSVSTAGGSGGLTSSHPDQADWNAGVTGSNVPTTADDFIATITNVVKTTGLVFKLVFLNSATSTSIATFFSATVLAGSTTLINVGQISTDTQFGLKKWSEYTKTMITSPNQITPTQLNTVVTANY